jgi:DNA-binding IclR family transcriptional regulator
MSTHEESPRSEQSVGTLKRGLSILQYVAANGEVTPVAVAKALNASRSTTYRILESLRGVGFLEVNQSSGRLRLGVKAIELGMAALAEIDVIKNAPPYLSKLAAGTLETVFLAIPNNDEMVYVFSEESTQPVKMNTKLGTRRPLHSTSLGKAYMSALPEEDRKALVARLELVPFTKNTITDPEQLESDLSASIVRGYAFDDVEAEEGVSCLAAPVRDYTGLPVAAISVSGPTERIVRKRDEIGVQVANTAEMLSRRLGFVSEGGTSGR